jgi:hypothetical protein
MAFVIVAMTKQMTMKKNNTCLFLLKEKVFFFSECIKLVSLGIDWKYRARLKRGGSL